MLDCNYPNCFECSHSDCIREGTDGAWIDKKPRKQKKDYHKSNYQHEYYINVLKPKRAEARRKKATKYDYYHARYLRRKAQKLKELTG